MLCANHASVTIRGLRCSKHGSVLCVDNPWIVQLLRNPGIAQRARVYSDCEWDLVRASWLKGKPEEYLTCSFVLKKKSGSDPSSV